MILAFSGLTMKAYTFIGAVFTVIGTAIFMVGLFLLVTAYQTYSSIGYLFQSSILNSVLITAFLPYLVGSIVFLVIGGIGFWAGKSKEPDVTVAVRNETTPSYTMESPEYVNENYGTDNSTNSIPNRSLILCGSCGASNDLDAVFCKICGNRFR
jgi:hypothetical protein